MVKIDAALIDEFLQKSIIRVSANTGLVQPLAEWFLNEFLSEPDDYKNQWTFEHNRTGDPDTGYFVKDGRVGLDGTLSDRKMVFHYRALSIEAKLRARGVYCSRHSHGLDLCSNLRQSCLETLRLFLTELDKVLPGYRFEENFLDPRVADEHVLRLVAYVETRDDDGTVIGQHHWDRCGLTLALGESAKGLRGGIERPYEPVTSLPNLPLIFASKKLEKMTAGQVKAWEHEVVHPGGRVSAEVIRWAVVFFANPYGVEFDEAKETMHRAY